MDKKSVAQLIEISHAVGSNREYVQAGGGNTSIKSPDGRTMAIKESGTTLLKMGESSGWVELDVSKVLDIFGHTELADLPSRKRESKVAHHLVAAMINGKGRPSVESSLHAFLGRVVIHTHPAAVIALTSGPGEKAIRELTRPGEALPLWIPYVDPGWRLAAKVRTAAEIYRQQHGHPPAVLLLENHGLFVTADDTRECLALHHDWVARCEAHFAPQVPPLASASPVDSATLRQTMLALRQIWQETRGTTGFARWSEEPELAGAAQGSGADALAAGAPTPDHVVYMGAHPLLAESLDELPAKLKSALTENSSPRLAVVRNVGSFLVADDPAKLEAAETLASSAAKIQRLASGRGGARNLSPSAIKFITEWEPEQYRASLLQPASAPLAGKVALVTGAGGGIGRGIGCSLLAAGAAVAFSDVDETGLAESVAAAGESSRVLPIALDVTSEQAVAAAFDRIVRHWGGIDIIVCNAGIAIPSELADFPLDKWRLSLDVNMTGYFLVAREAVRIMRAQGTGGAMVLITSKTALDASKGHTGYNAAKAGQQHMMRGWALELGRDGIRVNSIAPGFVFEGSKIWSRDYIEDRARRRGIKPEDVVASYVSLSALNREVKPADIGAATVFLCSEQSRCITGQTLIVDGGVTMVR